MGAFDTNSFYRPAQGAWPGMTGGGSGGGSRTPSALDELHQSFRPIGHEAAPPPSLSRRAPAPIVRPQPMARPAPPAKRGARRFIADLFRRRSAPAQAPATRAPPVMRVATDGLFGMRGTASPADEHSARVTSSASEYYGASATSFHRGAPRRRSRAPTRTTTRLRAASEFGAALTPGYDSDVFNAGELFAAMPRAGGNEMRRFDSVRTAAAPQRFDSHHVMLSRFEPSAFESGRDFNNRYETPRNDKWSKPGQSKCRGCAPRSRASWRRDTAHVLNCPRAPRAHTAAPGPPAADESIRSATPLWRGRGGSGEGFAARHMSWEGGAQLMRKLSRHRPGRKADSTLQGDLLGGRPDDYLGFMQMQDNGIRQIPAWSGGDVADDVMSSVTRGSESNDDH